jgi:hypothetical protein
MRSKQYDVVMANERLYSTHQPSYQSLNPGISFSQPDPAAVSQEFRQNITPPHLTAANIVSYGGAAGPHNHIRLSYPFLGSQNSQNDERLMIPTPLSQQTSRETSSYRSISSNPNRMVTSNNTNSVNQSQLLDGGRSHAQYSEFLSKSRHSELLESISEMKKHLSFLEDLILTNNAKLLDSLKQLNSALEKSSQQSYSAILSSNNVNNIMIAELKKKLDLCCLYFDCLDGKLNGLTAAAVATTTARNQERECFQPVRSNHEK